MTTSANLLKLDPDFRVLLPEGSTGGSGEIEYQSAYRVAALVAGATSGVKLVPETGAGANPRLARVLSLSDGDVYVLGALVGDTEPPPVTFRLYPELPSVVGQPVARGKPIVFSARPHEYPADSGLWDLRDLGGDGDRPQVISRQQLNDVEQVAALAEAAADSVTAAVLDLTQEKAAVQQAVADSAQSAALATAAAGITPRANLAAITGADGYYRAMDTGYVYQRSGGSNTRRADLEALPTAAYGLLAMVADAAINTLSIQARIDAAGTNAPGATIIRIPAGVHYHNGLSMRQNVTLQGEGVGLTTLVNVHPSNPSITIAGPGGSDPNPYGQHITISNMLIKADSVRAGQIGIHINLSRLWVLDRVIVRDHDIGVNVRTSWDGLITACHVRNCRINLQSDPTGPTGSAPNTILGSKFSSASEWNIDLRDRAGAWQFSGGAVEYATGGGLRVAAGCYAVSFDGVNFEHNAGPDVLIGVAGDTQIPGMVILSGCRFYHPITKSDANPAIRGVIGNGVHLIAPTITGYTTAIITDAGFGNVVYESGAVSNVATLANIGGKIVTGALWFMGNSVRGVQYRQSTGLSDLGGGTLTLNRVASEGTITAQDYIAVNPTDPAAYAFAVWKTSQVAPRLYVRGDGGLYWGDGNGPMDVTLSRTAPNVLSMAAGDSFAVEGAWNGGRLRLGAVELWVDNGVIRTKAGVPGSIADGTALGGALGDHRVKLSLSANQSIPNATLTAVTWPNETYDTDAYHDTVTNPARITIPAGQAGVYTLSANVGFLTSGTGRRSVRIRKNGGANLARVDLGAVTSGPTALTATVDDVAVAGDYYEVMVYQDCGAALDLDASQCPQTFSARRVQ